MKLHLICGKDNFRPNMNHVLVTKEYCVATNAHVLGAIPTYQIFAEESEKIPESGILIHSEDWKKISDSTMTNLVVGNDTIEIIYRKKPSGLIKFHTNGKDYTFPNWKAVVPDKVDKEEFTINAIRLNLKLGSLLQDALGGNTLILQFESDKKAVRVDVQEEPERFGCIMPMLINY